MLSRLRALFKEAGSSAPGPAGPASDAAAPSRAGAACGQHAGVEVRDEHFTPSRGAELAPYVEAGDVAAVHHLIRYEWAVAVLSEHPEWRRILDVACGSGYGSFRLATTFPDREVVGADYDPGAVEQARGAFSAPNLSFTTADLMRWDASLGPDLWDAVVSFDTLEHVPHREIALYYLVRRLQPAGGLLFSAPCSHREPILQPEWEFHRIEYSPETLLDFLGRYFDEILRPEDGTLPRFDVFRKLDGTGIPYPPVMNPLVCLKPLPDSRRRGR